MMCRSIHLVCSLVLTVNAITVQSLCQAEEPQAGSLVATPPKPTATAPARMDSVSGAPSHAAATDLQRARLDSASESSVPWRVYTPTWLRGARKRPKTQFPNPAMVRPDDGFARDAATARLGTRSRLDNVGGLVNPIGPVYPWTTYGVQGLPAAPSSVYESEVPRGIGQYGATYEYLGGYAPTVQNAQRVYRPGEPLQPGPTTGARRDLYLPRAGRFFPGYLNRDGTVDRVNTRTGSIYFGIPNRRGGQDLFDVRRGQFFFGFRNRDGTLDYLSPGGRWLWSTGR